MSDILPVGTFVRVDLSVIEHPIDAEKLGIHGWVGTVHRHVISNRYEILFKVPKHWLPDNMVFWFVGGHITELSSRYLKPATEQDLRNFILQHELTS